MSHRGEAGERGQATVELALALPMVALAVLVIVQIGLVVRDSVLVNHAAREGVRSAAVTSDPAKVRSAARAAGPLMADRLRVEIRRDAVSGSVEVRVRYRSRTEVPLVGAVLPDVDLSAMAVMRDEQASVDLGHTE